MIKTISFASVHFTIASIVAYALTGDILLSSLIAVTEPAINTLAFYFHEKAWKNSSNVKLKTASFAIVHFTVAFSVVWVLSGNPLIGGIMAMLEPSINTFAYYWHERVWQSKHQVNRHWVAAH
ncbi:DUF2061 domain-containing protein [Vibrio sp. SCSIO 43136]|uniref:DUF2061 domain-containing protein n=1 Tax=Vibrio sp. SCSIO 43136 TaxID=2819101 RepID=UPI0020753157|nr:DUF2061 domain-containing protein [Vibrio sp. SCSIO 43136]USD65586.1 DUF2061 domain-containing protein [Vibrio sp. SCSIO 43136]